MATNKSVGAPAPAGGAPSESKAGKYLSEVRTELKKTTWPTRQELIAQTQVVMGLLVVVGVYIAAWDFILGQVYAGLLRLLGIEARQ